MENGVSLARQSVELRDYLDTEALSSGDPDRRWEFGRGDKCEANRASIEPTVITADSTLLNRLTPGGSVCPAQAGASEILGGITKRVMDLTLASVALFLLLPLLVLIGTLIWATAGHPIFFTHTRIGQNGRIFRCYKFCTMVPNADQILRLYLADDAAALKEWNLTRKLAKDPRVTSLGQLLRKSSLDELPQLINVIRGEMSCVGPRPVVANELDRYGARKAEYLQARPGMTGLWQISGRSALSYEERVALDCHYIRNWSLWSDLKILWKTIPAMMRVQEAA
jgi:exopolysaccharide production protein ExoY